jgi:hypothetical protein
MTETMVHNSSREAREGQRGRCKTREGQHDDGVCKAREGRRGRDNM